MMNNENSKVDNSAVAKLLAPLIPFLNDSKVTEIMRTVRSEPGPQAFFNETRQRS